MINNLIKLRGLNFFYLILFIAFLVRLFPLNFPALTFEEARVAHRGYLLSTQGVDELGRKFPILFNSSIDYQFPLTSYVTSVGELIFGKNDFAVRAPFILIGVLLVLITYRISQAFSINRVFNLSVAILVAFSPPLVFLSKIPNETILLTFNLMLLLYLIIGNKKISLIILTVVLTLLTSKISWFILPPFIATAVYLAADKIDRRKKISVLGFVLVSVLVAFVWFFNVPQAKRSLMENNFPIFSDITVKNGIERMRAQGIRSNWPPVAERALFNKSEYLIVGIKHWLSHFNPGIYFGQFDQKGAMNFSFIGTWSKFLIIPMLVGIINMNWNRKKKALLLSCLVIFTFPAIFMYPFLRLDLIVLLLPFLSLIIAWGLINLNKKLAVLFICLMILELIINMINISQERKSTNALRPTWIPEIVGATHKSSQVVETYVSDDLVSDIVPFIGWYTPIDINPENIPYPYKYRQYKLRNINILGSDEKFENCTKEENKKFFVSKRDLKKMNYVTDLKIIKTYYDNLGVEIGYELGGKICLFKSMP